MPVLDASVLIEYLAGGAHAASARARIRDGEAVWAPHLIDAEVGHVLRRAVAADELSAATAAAALDDLASLQLRRVRHVGLLRRAWELRHNLSFYDGLYVALAERLDMPLVTLDARIRAAPGIEAMVEVL